MKDDLCRLCLGNLDSDDCGYSISNDRFRKALEQVFTFKISFEEDDLPEYTCKQCSWNVLDFQTFSELVQRNQEKMQERSLQTKPTAGQENTSIPTEVAYDEERIERSVTNDFEALNTLSDVLKRSSRSLEKGYKIRPDHDEHHASKAAPDADQLGSNMILEEYIITSNQIVQSGFNGSDEVFDGKEPSAKKPKSQSYNASTKEKHSVSNNEQFASKVYPCDECEKTFDSKCLLEYHKQGHTSTPCMLCKKAVSKKHFNLHMTSHLADFNCKLCGKKFLSPRECKSHRNVCTERKYAAF